MYAFVRHKYLQFRLASTVNYFFPIGVAFSNY